MRSCKLGRSLAASMLLIALSCTLATCSNPLLSDTTFRRGLSKTMEFTACGAGNVFTREECGTVSQAADLDSESIDHSPEGACKNFIQCGDGGGELYSVKVETWSGTDTDTQDDKYYAVGTAVRMDSTQKPLKYCWKRFGAKGDGCGCICAVVLKQSVLGKRSECKCVFSCPAT